jgi:hypothetical protein
VSMVNSWSVIGEGGYDKDKEATRRPDAVRSHRCRRPERRQKMPRKPERWFKVHLREAITDLADPDAVPLAQLQDSAFSAFSDPAVPLPSALLPDCWMLGAQQSVDIPRIKS